MLDARMPSTKSEQESIKWWVDQQRSGEGRREGPPAPAAARFYITAKGFEQERARAGLVDLNVKLLESANPPENGFAILSLLDERAPQNVVDRIKRALPLPNGARAAIVDSGRRMVRAIVTGSPPGERILEFNFNRDEPTFDVWVRGDWKEEIVFRNLDEIYRAARVLIDEYMGPEALAKPELWT